MFSHEKLKVYQKTLAFIANALPYTKTWTGHAISDQFSRASSSIAMNLAEAATLPISRNKQKTADFAVGSALECAACLDVAYRKALLEEKTVTSEKLKLLEITKMLYGLKQSWAQMSVKEDSPGYTHESITSEVCFFHEKLEVYQSALNLISLFTVNTFTTNLPTSCRKDIDQYSTSILLNIAEGNGRFAELDHRRFLRIAEVSAIKTATSLDIFAKRDICSTTDIEQSKQILVEIVSGLKKMQVKLSTKEHMSNVRY